MKDLNHVYRDITEFIFVEHAPSPADLIILVGGSDPSLAVMAADLYHQKMAPKILAGGRYSLKLGHFANEKLKGTPYEGQMFETEAAFYRHILLEHHVPTEDILLEEASTNTGENAAFALKLTRERGRCRETADRLQKFPRPTLSDDIQSILSGFSDSDHSRSRPVLSRNGNRLSGWRHGQESLVRRL